MTTLSLYFPNKEITFPVLGPINCRVHFLEQKLADVLDCQRFPIEIASVGLTLSKYKNTIFSYLLEPMIAIPFSFADLSNSIYSSQDPTSSTALAIARIAFSSLVFAYVVKSTQNGSLRDFSEYLWDSSRKANDYLKQIEEKGIYTDAEFSEPFQIPIKSTWSKVLSFPAKVVNAILERLHLAWLKLKSLLQFKI